MTELWVIKGCKYVETVNGPFKQEMELLTYYAYLSCYEYINLSLSLFVDCRFVPIFAEGFGLVLYLGVVCGWYVLSLGKVTVLFSPLKCGAASQQTLFAFSMVL